MTNTVSRRYLLKASAAVTAGAAGALAALGEPAAAAPVGASRIGRVRRPFGDTVEVELLDPDGTRVAGVVTVPVAGFPEGWSFRAGDRVLVTGPNGADHPSTAMPLVTRLVGPVRNTGVGTVSVSGQELRLRPNTIRPLAQAADATLEAYYINNDRDGTLACVVLRPLT